MTEGMDAAARMPPSEPGRSRPATADQSFRGALSERGSAAGSMPGRVPGRVPGSMPGHGGPAASLPGAAMTAPVPAGSAELMTPAGNSGAGGPRDTGRPGGPPGGSPRGHGAAAGTDADDQPFARVDAKKLEAALLALRHPIITVPLLLEAPGVTEARAERVKLLSQIDDYLLPRLRQSGAPILVALVGSTGAGKSTLMNSVVAKQVSATGIRRPTTNSPVLACHPDDMRWFAENVFLPTLPRVRQQGLAMPGRDGLLVLAASEGMPKGVAVLDTPDIDSVVQAHRDFADQFLDASDLWLFVTTARRYADAAVWEMLQDARDRGAALAIAMSRVPPHAAVELSAHFDAMLEANGLREVRRFIIPETVITDAQLPAKVTAPIREWLADTARREDRRVAVLTQTMSGVLDTFRSRVPALADQVTVQVALRNQLRQTVTAAFAAGLAGFDEATRDGSLLCGEVLARWQDFAATGDLLRTLQLRRGRGGRQRKQQLPARAVALKGALQASMVSLVTATADRAAELVVAGWQEQPAGGGFLAEHGAAGGGHDGSGGTPGESDFVAAALADLGLVSDPGADAADHNPASLARATAGLAETAAAAVIDWLQHVRNLVKDEKVTRRSIARVVSFDEESLALVLTIGVLGPAAVPDGPAGAADRPAVVPDGPAGAPDGPAAVPDGPAEKTGAVGDAVPRALLESLFGAGLLRDIGARIRLNLRERVAGLLTAEAERYFAIIDSAGVPEEAAAGELLRAGAALEEAR